MALNPPLILPNRFDPGTLIRAGAINDNYSAITNIINANGRTILSAPMTTFYVGPGGTDGGIPTSATQPAATVGYVLTLLQNNYDLNRNAVTIQLLDGSYSENINVRGTYVGQVVPNSITIQGNVADPTRTVLTGYLSSGNHASITIQSMQLTNPNGSCLIAQSLGILYWQHINFGIAGAAHVHARTGALVSPLGDYTISAGAVNHVICDSGAIVELVQTGIDSGIAPGVPTITLLGNPNFSGAFIQAGTLGSVRCSATFVGTATGVRYNLLMNATLGNGGRNDIPGNQPGILATGGQYN